MADSKTKKKTQTTITNIGGNRYKAQRGRILVTFTVSESFGVTAFEGLKSEDVKAYHFVNSDPFHMWMVAKTLKDVAEFVNRMKRESEESHEA